MIRDRDISPFSNISKALFTRFSSSEQPSSTSRKRSSRPSLEDDLRRSSNENQENIDPGDLRRSSTKLSKPSYRDSPKKSTERNHLGSNSNRPRGLSNRNCNKDAEVFQYPSPLDAPPRLVKSTYANSRPIPRISINPDDDEVFDTSCVGIPIPPPSGKLIPLTPSTAHTPTFRCSSSSSQYLSSLIPSPNIERGVCCSTPNRIKLESEGLSSTEKMVLGRGAFGTVVLGKWKGKKVAIKVMEKEEGGRTNRRRKSLESELQAKNLEHKNIVRVYDVYAKDNQYAIIIMEYVGSRNLHRLLIESRDKVLDPGLLLTAAKHVSSALAHCHSKGIIHLDVKPSNVLVNSQGVFKLGDFGCSVSSSSPSLEVDHSLVGTPGYQAPEFLRGNVPSPACDIYSLAILFWQLDAREIPFSGQHPQSVMYQVVAAGVRPCLPSPSVSCVNILAFTSLYKSCWHKSPSFRPRAEDIVESLRIIINRREETLPTRVSSKDSNYLKISKSMRF